MLPDESLHMRSHAHTLQPYHHHYSPSTASLRITSATCQKPNCFIIMIIIIIKLLGCTLHAKVRGSMPSTVAWRGDHQKGKKKLEKERRNGLVWLGHGLCGPSFFLNLVDTLILAHACLLIWWDVKSSFSSTITSRPITGEPIFFVGICNFISKFHWYNNY